jgi:NADH:ubiquinone oxidoreductase subunit
MEKISLIRRLSQMGTRVQTCLFGHLVGRDDFGNSYYRSKKTPKGVREKRWVLYQGEPEASKVPPEWHIWLHHTAAEPISADSPFRQSWQIPYQ